MKWISNFAANWKAASRNIWGFSVFPKIGKLLGQEYEAHGSSAPMKERGASSRAG